MTQKDGKPPIPRHLWKSKRNARLKKKALQARHAPRRLVRGARRPLPRAPARFRLRPLARGAGRLRPPLRRDPPTQLGLNFSGRSVVDVIGRSRPIEKVYPDGDYNCPFCGAAAGGSRHPQGCPNPGCPAGKNREGRWSQTPESARRAIAAHEARVAEEAERERTHKRRMEELERSRAARQREENAALEECRRRGACERCFLADGGGKYGRKPKYVKHRGPCPRERR